MSPSFDPQRILDVLCAHQVRFVVIGGSAAILHGAAYVTEDVDVCPATDRENLAHLSDALTELAARIRVEGIPEGIEFSHDGESLGRAVIWNLVTNAGILDIAIDPAGVNGFVGLEENAVEFDLGEGVVVLVASLDDVIRSKRAANRPKDLQALPMLEAMRDRLR